MWHWYMCQRYVQVRSELLLWCEEKTQVVRGVPVLPWGMLSKVWWVKKLLRGKNLCPALSWLLLSCFVWFILSYLILCASQFQPRASPPRANPGHLFHDESRVPGIWQLIVSRPPGYLQTTTNLFGNILSSFPTALRVKGFKQSNTVILE